MRLLLSRRLEMPETKVKFTQAMADGHEPWPECVEEIGDQYSAGFDTVPVLRTPSQTLIVRPGDWLVKTGTQWRLCQELAEAVVLPSHGGQTDE
jgi:hypothetical protein